MLTADASRGAFLSGFTVVAVPLMAGLCGTAKLKRSTWGAVVACLVGISLLEDSGAPASWGDFWSFASAVLFGAQVREGRRAAVVHFALRRRCCHMLGLLDWVHASAAQCWPASPPAAHHFDAPTQLA